MFEKNLQEILANLDQCLTELETNDIWKDVVMKNYRLTDQSFKIAFNEFRAACMVGVVEENTGGLMRYFSHWYPKNKERLSKVNVSQPKRI